MRHLKLTVFLSLAAGLGLMAVPHQGFSAPAPAKVSPQNAARAERLYAEGADLFSKGRFPEAAAKFEAAWTLDPSPILLYNLARAYEEMGDLQAASNRYRDYLDQYSDAPDRDEVERRIRTMQAALKRASEVGRLMVQGLPADGALQFNQLPAPAPDAQGGWPLRPGNYVVEAFYKGTRIYRAEADITINRQVVLDLGASPGFVLIQEMPDKATTTVDGRPAPAPDAQGRRALTPGPHEIVIEASDQKTWRKPVVTRAGETLTLTWQGQAPTVTPETTTMPPPREGGWQRTAAWASLGVATATASGALYFTLKASNASQDRDDLVEAIRGGDTRPGVLLDLRDTESEIDDHESTANIFWTTTGLTVAIGVGLLVWDLLDDSEEGEGEVDLNAAIGPGFLGLGGSF